jgi:hypothetical protein
MDLTSIVPIASRQDLTRIRGYVAWLAFAMCWHLFLALLIMDRSTYWIQRLAAVRLLHQPRSLAVPLYSRTLYTDATPTSIAAVTPGPPLGSTVQHYVDSRPIAFAEMAAALRGLIWYMQTLHRPTTVTLCTDSSVVYYTLLKGRGLTLRSSAILQTLYCKMLLLKIKAGHALVLRWVLSHENLADPLTREYPP